VPFAQRPGPLFDVRNMNQSAMSDDEAAAVRGPLVHMTTPSAWRVALSAGSLVVPSLRTEGFTHLSSPQQVAVPANAIYAGRDDLLLLVVDPARVGSDVRWEPGVHGDPGAMRFPHLYGPLPAAAVTSVVPYRPGDDGRFVAPTSLPLPGDAAARARTFERSLAERRAAIVVPVTGGVATLDPRVPASWEHNGLWIDDDLDAATLVAEADRALAGLGHRRAVLAHPPPADLGWAAEELRFLVLDPSAPMPRPPASAGRVTAVTQEVMAGLWRPSWRRDLPDVNDAAVEDLVRREAFADAHARIVDLAVLGEAGVPIAGAQLRLDGATAAIESVMTDPDHVGHGHATALMGDAIGRARAAGCDVVWLLARAGDWPRGWYERLGFVDVGARWEVVRRATT
jgi:uncharacterized protein (DUF952 family)/GNAT superfamily N-acetyltransferase